MAEFFKVSASKEMIRDSGSNSYIHVSGMYDVVIHNILVNKSPNGAVMLGFYFNYDGTDQVIYNAIIMKNNDGKDNSQINIFNKMLLCFGAKEGDVIGDPVEKVLPIGKDKAEQTVLVVPDIEEEPIILRIKVEYDSYEGKITEHKWVRNVFRSSDKASASEIINKARGTDVGKQYALELNDKSLNEPAYRHGVTKEDVEAYRKRFTGGNNTASDEPKAKTFSSKSKGSEEQMDDLPF